jgi:hypothetical protein
MKESLLPVQDDASEDTTASYIEMQVIAYNPPAPVGPAQLDALMAANVDNDIDSFSWADEEDEDMEAGTHATDSSSQNDSTDDSVSIVLDEDYLDARYHADARCSHKRPYLIALLFEVIFALLLHFVGNKEKLNKVTGTFGLKDEQAANLEILSLLISTAAFFDLLGGVANVAQYPDRENILNTLRPAILLPIFSAVFGAMKGGSGNKVFYGQTGEQTGAEIGGYVGFMLVVLIVMGRYIWEYDRRNEIQREVLSFRQRSANNAASAELGQQQQARPAAEVASNSM